MTTRYGQLKNLSVAVAMLFVAACSSGKNSMSNPKPSANATVRGAVQGFAGGLQVNGVAFRTAGAHIHLPDDSLSPVLLETEDSVKSHLDDGMVVTVRGTLDDNGVSGQATEIEFHDLMEATIDDKGAGRIRLLGDDLSMDLSTEIMDRHGNKLTPDDLTIGERVEVSGHGDGKGGMRASFVRVRDDNALLHKDHEAKGYVIAISGTVLDLSFTKGGPLGLRADIALVASPPAIAVGDLVEVSFSETNADPTGDGIPDAISVQLEDPFEAEPQEEVEVEGIVTAVDATGFTVDGQPVIPDPGARFEGGTAADVVVGVELEAEGVMGADGVLHARKVKFEANARIEANLEAKDELAGTLTVLGRLVHFNPSTELRGFVAVSDLAIGNNLEIRGRPTADGTGIDATRIELKSTSPADRAFLRAVVTAKTPTTSLTMMGLTIDTSAASFTGPSDPAAFFAAITPGQTLVKVRWRPYPASTSEPIDEAELEN